MGGDLKKDEKKILKKYQLDPFLFLNTFEFDVLKWWSASSKAQPFKHICPLAIAYLSIPDSNAFQERVFSISEFVYDKRGHRINKLSFEMKTLLCTNKDLMKGAKEYMEHTDKDPVNTILKFMANGNSEIDIAEFATADDNEIGVE
jgi:hypothetical protein